MSCKTLSLAVALALGTVPAAFAASDDFVDAAVESGIAEVVAGKLALEKSQAADVRAFAELMVKEHTEVNQQLMALAQRLDIDIPNEASLTDKARKMILEMRDESFDSAYLNNQVDAHQKAVELFKREGESSDKPELKAFANETLPNLEQHLNMAKQLQASHGK